MSLHGNDPCLCGSGKKYRQCCMNQDYSQVSSEPEQAAVEVVLDWLLRHHRKAMAGAKSALLSKLLSEKEVKKLESIREWAVLQGIEINLTEWLLSQGHMLVGGEMRHVNSYLLGPKGPALTPYQRQWLTQMGNVPLRLYTVTDVVPGKQMTLCEILNPEALPVVVQEKLGTHSITPGMHLGGRPMRVDTHMVMSGAMYHFGLLQGNALADKAREIEKDIPDPQQAATKIALCILQKWLHQYVRKPEMPVMVDTYSGETIRLITELYTVDDWSALERVLAACPDVVGDGISGWSREKECEDGKFRPLVHINLGKQKNTVELFTKTLTYAEQAHLWFEALAPGLVHFQGREEVDPRKVKRQKPAGAKATPSQERDLPAAELEQFMEKALHNLYANWADEPLPAINNKTPRQTMQTPAGLERVKGLIRSYEANEKRMAEEQQRNVVSLAFMWQSLGLTG